MISSSFFGHLTQDARVAGADGEKFISFTVAVNDGGDAYFLDCAYWSTSLLNYLKKGSAVFVMGKLRARPFIDGKGAPRPGLRCNVLAVRLAGATPRAGESSEPQAF